MGGELAEAAALHARLMVEQQVTDLYTGDCRGCGVSANLKLTTFANASRRMR